MAAHALGPPGGPICLEGVDKPPPDSQVPSKEFFVKFGVPRGVFDVKGLSVMVGMRLGL